MVSKIFVDANAPAILIRVELVVRGVKTFLRVCEI